MITEQDRERLEIEKLQDGIRLCEESLAKAEPYERLFENKDFKGFLDDMRKAADIHQREIILASSMIPDAANTTCIVPDSSQKPGYRVMNSKSDWTDYIARHQIQRQELLNWTEEPGHIIALAKTARASLPVLKEKLATYKGHRPSDGNGSKGKD